MEEPGNLVTALIVSISSTLITAQLALYHFRSNNLWARKSDAYDKAIQAMTELSRISNDYYEEALTHKEISEDERHRREETLRQARVEVERSSRLGGYVISRNAQEALQDYLFEKWGSHHSSWEEHIEHESSITRRCLQELIRCARKDLGIKD